MKTSRDANPLPRLVYLVLILACMGAKPAAADVGTAAGGTLLQPLSARPAALGEAYAGEGGSIESLGYNPAGLSTVDQAEFSAMYHAGFAGDTFVSALLGAPFRGFGIAVGAAFYSAGTVERLDPTGGISEVSAQRDLLGQAGVGYRFPRTALSVGASAKALRTELIEEISSTEIAADAGARLEVPAVGLALGAAAQHLGGRLKLEEDSAALPSLLRFGLAYQVHIDRTGPRFGTMRSVSAPVLKPPLAPHRLLVLVEYLTRIQEAASGFAVGAEYSYAGVVAVRLGFRSLTRGAAARHDVYTGGLGVRLPAFRLDYAVERLPSFTSLHRLSLTVTPKR